MEPIVNGLLGGFLIPAAGTELEPVRVVQSPDKTPRCFLWLVSVWPFGTDGRYWSEGRVLGLN